MVSVDEVHGMISELSFTAGQFLRGACALVAILLCIMPAFAADAPPRIYVDKGACPFECCTYRKWLVTTNTRLFDKVAGTKLVDEVKKGEVVRAITGEVHVIPEPIGEVGGACHSHPAYLLTYQGEGFFKLWCNGKVADEAQPFLNLPSDKVPKADWWVLIETSRGKQGWTRQPDHFDNKDQCGGVINDPRLEE